MKGLIEKLGVIVFTLGALLAGSAGATLPINIWGGFGIGVAIWTILYVLFGWRTVDQNTVLPIERFGIYSGFWPAGPAVLCFPGLIDREKEPVSLAAQEIRLYVDEDGTPRKNMAVDFVNMTAPVDAKVLWRIDPTAMSWNIKKFLYATDDALKYIADVCDDALRHALSTLTLDEAKAQKNTIAKELAQDPDITRALGRVGACLFGKGVLLTDIQLPPAIEAMQNLALEGEKMAGKTTLIARGQAQAIAALKMEAGKLGVVLTDEQATDLYLKGIGLDALKGSGANITLVGENVGSILGALIGNRSKNP